MSVQFKRSTWGPQFNGEAETDLLPGEIWPGHVGQSARQAILVSSNERRSQRATAMPRPTQELLPSSLPSMSGRSTSLAGGRRRVHRWRGVSRLLACRSVGQGLLRVLPDRGVHLDAGAESLRGGGIHFAGEHTCRYGNRGTMNGAVSSGQQSGARGEGAGLVPDSPIRTGPPSRAPRTMAVDDRHLQVLPKFDI